MPADANLAAMTAAAREALIHVLDLVPDDRVLVVTDEPTLACGRAFAAAAEAMGCPVATYVLPQEERPLRAMPPEMADLAADHTVVINAIIGDVREVPFRLEWLRLLEGSPVIRYGHSPGIDPDMMIGGPLNVDYGLMQARARQIQEAFADAESVRITSAAGTDLVLDLTGRRLVSDLKASPGVGCNLPCGEVYCCPVETGADGTLVIDACYGSAGIVPAPVTFAVAGGRVTDVDCPDGPTLADVTALLDTDRGSRTIAELGIGLNPGARLTDRMLEAEKTAGTAHIAFGTNEGMPGGRGVSSVHIDYLFTKPTLVVSAGGGERVVMVAGRVQGRD